MKPAYKKGLDANFEKFMRYDENGNLFLVHGIFEFINQTHQYARSKKDVQARAGIFNHLVTVLKTRIHIPDSFFRGQRLLHILSSKFSKTKRNKLFLAHFIEDFRSHYQGTKLYIDIDKGEHRRKWFLPFLLEYMHSSMLLFLLQRQHMRVSNDETSRYTLAQTILTPLLRTSRRMMKKLRIIKRIKKLVDPMREEANIDAMLDQLKHEDFSSSYRAYLVCIFTASLLRFLSFSLFLSFFFSFFLPFRYSRH